MTDDYFDFDPVMAAEGGYFGAIRDVVPITMSEGLSFQPLLGEQMLINIVRFEPHTEAPRHIHDEEQIIFVLEGELEVELGDETRSLGPWEAALIPPNVPHAARTGERGCTELDIFSPPRAALLELMKQQGDEG